MTSSLHQIVGNSLWFAFDALDLHKTGVVDKARLKELTRQVGEALCLDRAVEACLTDYRSTDTLTFDQYMHFLEYEVFSDVCGSNFPYSSVERAHSALDALLWEVGRHSLAPRYPAVLSPADTFKVFRVYCLLADRSTAAGGDLVQVSLRRSEVCEICRQLVEGLGLDWDWHDWQLVSASIGTFPLPVFLTFLEGRYGHNSEQSALSASVDAMYKFFVGQVFFQGRAYQRITRAGGWLRRDIEVVPWGIRASADTSEDLPDEGRPLPPSGKLTAAVGRSLTLGRNAVGVMGGAMKSGVTEVVERSRTLTRGSPTSSGPDSPDKGGGTPKRGFSLGRWGSTSGINNKKRDRRGSSAGADTASLGGGESPVPNSDIQRSHTLDRASLRSAKSSSTIGSSPSFAKSPGGGGGVKIISPKPAKETTKGVVGGVIGRVWKLEITPETTVTSLKDTSSGRPCKISIINTPTARPIVIAAHDHKSKARLLAALQEAIQHCTDMLPYQMRLSQSRRSEEEQAYVLASEERVRRSSQADIIEQTQAELAAERTAREEAECLAQSEATARAAEEERVLELTALREQLEALLLQETQAKRDEEIVRNLQARVLREEWAKREELERLQQEQQTLLEEEQRKRRAFELLQKDQEKKLREAESRLKSLDENRRRLDEDLRSAREKIVMSGRGKQVLEAKMKVQQGRRPPIRTLSLRPSRQERASPARSSSFTTPPTRLAIPSPTHSGGGLSPTDDTSGSLTHLSAGTPGHSSASTPATSPSGAAANRSILEYLENGGGENGSAGVSSTPPKKIKSIPEQDVEEDAGVEEVGWRVAKGESTNGIQLDHQETSGDVSSENQLLLNHSESNGGDGVEVNIKLPDVTLNDNQNENNDNDDAAAATTAGSLNENSFIEIKTYEESNNSLDSGSSAVVITETVTKTMEGHESNEEVLNNSVTEELKIESSITEVTKHTKENVDTKLLEDAEAPALVNANQK